MVAASAEKYRRARKLLREAVALDPTDAGLWFEMGRAYEDDPHGDDRKAARRYKKAAQLNANEPKYKAALSAAGKSSSSIHVYPGTHHGFHADYREVYDEAAAKDGWARMKEHFSQNGLAP